MSEPSRIPGVCVLVPCRNGGRFLKESLASVVEQTRAADEVVLIDDGSDDGAVEALRPWLREKGVELVENTSSMGKAACLNREFQRRDADYFVLQDADDVALPDRIESQVAFMERDRRLGCSSGFVEYIGAEGRRLGRGVLDVTTEERLADYLAGDDPFGLFCPAAIVRAEVVSDPALGFRGRFWPADDIDLWNRIAEAGWKVLAQPEVLVRYRIHGSSVVTSAFVKGRMQYEWVRESLRARRRGEPEPSQEQFERLWDEAPLTRKISRWRKIRGKGLYRSAGFALAERSFGRALVSAAGAVVLQPGYAIKRAWSQCKRAVS